ncbi:MAG: histidine ammonia-lyase, partial [Alphaproteobacteria bacterium]|nr:histidine ammonia-lyase [Alphaproteobacteria bacterium]
MTQADTVLTLVPGQVDIDTLRLIYRDGVGVRLDDACHPAVRAAADKVTAAANGAD